MKKKKGHKSHHGHNKAAATAKVKTNDLISDLEGLKVKEDGDRGRGEVEVNGKCNGSHADKSTEVTGSTPPHQSSPSCSNQSQSDQNSLPVSSSSLPSDKATFSQTVEPGTSPPDISKRDASESGKVPEGSGACESEGNDISTVDILPPNSSASADDMSKAPISYVVYESELQMPDIMRLIQKDLSEPYSIYTYRYFIHNWPHLCYMAHVSGECVGAIVCKLDYHKKIAKRGYIAMLAVDSKVRKRKIGSTLVRMAIEAMIAQDADEIVLETEITNKPALRLYENLGFVRDKRLFRYYLNGVDALRLKLWLR